MKVYISDKISEEIFSNLTKYAEDIILLPDFDQLPVPVASHADMLMYKLNESLLVHKEYYDKNHDLFEDVKVTLTDEFISNAYPNDILLNALNLRGTVYCKADYVSRYIRADAVNIVNLKQGYARCSVCNVCETAIITADRNIANSVKDIDVLLIKEGGIKLDGYNYGFIGGASAKIDRKILFFGDISEHPGYKKITEFCGKYDTEVISLSDEMLYDYGSMVII